MAAAASSKRDSTASKLRDSIRQLRRYIDGESYSERILIQKCDKIDVDREELLAKHHTFAEKTSTSLEDEELRSYIEPKIDEAVDIVDEATLLIEKLQVDSKNQRENSNEGLRKEKEKIEIATTRMEAESSANIMSQLLDSLSKDLLLTSPTKVDAVKVEMILLELQRKEEEVIKSWNAYKNRVTDEHELQRLISHHEQLLSQISQRRIQGRMFVENVKEAEPSRNFNNITEPVTTSIFRDKLQKMKPPKFSGYIRDFARFKSDFEKIVQSSYNDPFQQVYTMKQNCLDGEARDLVRNIDTLEEI